MTDTATNTSKRNGYSLEDDLMPIIKGEVEIPNLEEIDLPHAINNAVCCEVHNARIRLPGATRDWDRKRAIVALEMSPMGRVFQGTGIVLWEAGYPTGGKAARFAICKHRKVDDPGADHRRGWHPGACAKCGLDMTVDSGD